MRLRARKDRADESGLPLRQAGVYLTPDRRGVRVAAQPARVSAEIGHTPKLEGQGRQFRIRRALAVWDYAEASARRIFGGRMGWGLADDVRDALRADGEQTLTRLHGRFARHVRADELRAALALLEARGLVIPGVRTTGGRPASTWRVTEPGGVE